MFYFLITYGAISAPIFVWSYTINDGVERWWDNQNRGLGNKNVNMVGYVVSKSVAEEREECEGI